MTKVQNELKNLIDSIDDVEMINKLVQLNSLAEQEANEQQAFMDKYVALREDYRNAILHSAFKEEPQSVVDEPKQVSFMDVVNNILSNEK